MANLTGAKKEEKTSTLIERIRQEIGCGRVPTADVLLLCERAEMLPKMERAIHEAIKEVERLQAIVEKTAIVEKSEIEKSAVVENNA